MVLFYRLSGSLAAFSFCGAMFVIITYFSMKVLRKHPTNMVVYLSVCDLLFSLKFIVTALYPGSGDLENEGWTCILQAGWAQFWGMASISWIAMISLNLIIEMYKQGFARTSAYAKYYHIYVWSISVISTIVMFFGTSKPFAAIGSSGDGTCWVEDPRSPLKLLFFVPLLVYFAVSIVTVLLAFTRTGNGVMSDASRRGVMLRMTSYVAVFILCWSLPLAHRIYNFRHNDEEEKDNPKNPSALLLLDAVGISIQGFANSMVWLSNPSFFVAFKKRVLDKYFGFMFATDNEKHPLLSEIQNNLADSRQDFTVLGHILRKNIITCILLGIQRSMQDLVRFDTVTQKNYADIKRYSSDELAGDLSESSQTFEFLDYSPLVFAHIREISSISMETYKESMNVEHFLGKIANAKFSDGRSDSFFIFSPDKKFILKTISDQEAEILLKMLPSLHQYFRANPHSLITRFYGCHAVRVPHGDLVHVVVMGNVFSSGLGVHECYDLKGSWVNRSAGLRIDPSKLGMDLDFNRKVRLEHSVKAMFLDQLQKDALLLCSLNIMDYSLLLGIHFTDRDPAARSSFCSTSVNGVELVQFITNVPDNAVSAPQEISGSQGLAQLVSQDRGEIYMVGIIDVLQAYNKKKKLERFMKVYILQKDGEGLSAMPPQPYAKRFAKGMRNITSQS